MKSKLSRRDFLKLVSLLPLLGIDLPYFSGVPEQPNLDPNAQNVLILVFDAWSARHMSLHGYQRETMPYLNQIAERAIVYHNHYAGGSFTNPGTAALLTGTLPWTNRAFNRQGTIIESKKNNNIFNLFAENNYFRVAYSHNPRVNVLLEQLQENLDTFTPMHDLLLNKDGALVKKVFYNDYDIASDSQYYLLQIDKGYNNSLFLSRFYQWLLVKQNQVINILYGNQFPRGIPKISSLYYYLLENAIDWIQTQITSHPQPYLAYYHLFPPHGNYRTRREFVDVFEGGWNPVNKPEHFFTEGKNIEQLRRDERDYDEYLLYVDAEFNRLFNFMDSNGVLENTWVVLTSDHGEMFERGIKGHMGKTLHEPLIRAPLLIFPPGQKTRTDVYTPTNCIDILPTLLQVTGQHIPDWCEGEVLPPFSSADPDNQRSIFVLDAKNNDKFAPLETATFSIRKGQYKLMYYLGYEGYHQRLEVYNLEDDPEELINLAPSVEAIEDLPPPERDFVKTLFNELQKKIQAVNEPYQ